ncbi:hypothetical protein NL676_010930 [Syzygium grande]|nr:hypothetical protein NL676_010930 [Syzygium grande]
MPRAKSGTDVLPSRECHLLTNNGVIFTGLSGDWVSQQAAIVRICLDSLQDDLITACPWDPRVNGEFFHQTTFSVGLFVIKSFIEDIQQLIALILKLCSLELYSGILMRY